MKKCLSIALLIAAVSAVAPAALAIDTKTYPGSTCRQVSGGAYTFFGGSVYNASSTSDMQLMCPLVMDGASMHDAAVWFFDRSSSVNPSCTIFSEDIGTGGSLTQFFSTASPPAGTNSVEAQAGGISSLAAGLDYYATCTIPHTTASGASHVIAFIIDES